MWTALSRCTSTEQNKKGRTTKLLAGKLNDKSRENVSRPHKVSQNWGCVVWPLHSNGAPFAPRERKREELWPKNKRFKAAVLLKAAKVGKVSSRLATTLGCKRAHKGTNTNNTASNGSTAGVDTSAGCCVCWHCSSSTSTASGVHFQCWKLSDCQQHAL